MKNLKKTNLLIVLAVITSFFMSCEDQNEVTEISNEETLELIIDDPFEILNESQMKIANELTNRLQGNIISNEKGGYSITRSHKELGITKATYENVLFHLSNHEKNQTIGREMVEYFGHYCDNKSGSLIYVKPESLNVAHVVSGGNQYNSRIDGVGIPFFSSTHVYKVPDFGRVNVYATYLAANYLTLTAIAVNGANYGWHQKSDATFPQPPGNTNYGGWLALFNSIY